MPDTRNSLGRSTAHAPAARSNTSQAKVSTVIPDTARLARQRLLEIAEAVRDEAMPKMRTMIQCLERDATDLKVRDSARVMAARAVVNFGLEAARVCNEIESGVTPGSGNEGQSINILVMSPDGTSKAATAADQQVLIDEITKKLSAERAASSK